MSMLLNFVQGLYLVAGVLFIGSLAFANSPLHYTESVIGVLLASVVAALLGLGWLRMVLPNKHARA